jgi:nucleoside-diphosphate-sugar epimerase
MALITGISSCKIGDNELIEISLRETGKPRREFLHANDMADSCVYIMQQKDFIDK